MIIAIYLVGFIIGMLYGLYLPVEWIQPVKVLSFIGVVSVGYLIACVVFYKITK